MLSFLSIIEKKKLKYTDLTTFINNYYQYIFDC